MLDSLLRPLPTIFDPTFVDALARAAASLARLDRCVKVAETA
jgi:hypothetical protein